MAATRKPVERRRTPESVAAGAAVGHREGLQAMRDKLAKAMDDAPDAVVAQIAGQLRIVLAELAALDRAQPAEVSKVDELAARRQSGRATSNTRAPARRGRQVRGS